MIPTPSQTLFLRACLHSGPSGRDAWDAWSRQVGDPLKALTKGDRDVRGLLPLLLSALRRNGIQADAPLLTYLRSAQLTEALRSSSYRRLCGSAISAMTDHGIRAVVLRGAALAETVYQEPALRHCHDIDVLVEGDDTASAAMALALVGFEPVQNGRSHMTLAHESGLPLVLQSRLFGRPYRDPPFNDVWARRETLSIGGVAAHIPSPADHLLHVCGHASLRWVCDAWSLIEHSDIDWQLLFDSALRGRLAAPLSITLGYLADDLQAPIPPDVLGELRDARAPRAIRRMLGLVRKRGIG
jgi:hypothetical protein